MAFVRGAEAFVRRNGALTDCEGVRALGRGTDAQAGPRRQNVSESARRAGETARIGKKFWGLRCRIRRSRGCGKDFGR